MAALVPSAGTDAGASTEVSGLVRVAGKPAADVVIWLDGVRDATASRPRVVLDQRNLTFLPRVLAVGVGTAVNMPNSDRVFHNVFSFKDGKKFDLGLYPVGLSKTVVFDRAGVSRIFCNIHPNMAAYVVVVDSDAFAVSSHTGAFTLSGVSAGTYAYRIWRAGADVVTGEVTVGGSSPFEIDLP